MSELSQPPDLKPQWFQILLVIADRNLHGYAIISDVLERTEGRMRLWPGMLYGFLKRMVAVELIEEVEGSAGSPEDNKERRFSRITPHGKQALSVEAKRLAAFVETARLKDVFIDG